MKQDTGDAVTIKSKSGVLLTEDKDIRERWKEYFEELLNKENDREELRKQST